MKNTFGSERRKERRKENKKKSKIRVTLVLAVLGTYAYMLEHDS